MESKYKERAIKILVEHYGCDDIEDLRVCFLKNFESITMILEAMCLLAEEVEIRYKLEMITGIKQILGLSKNDYTKEQVKVLLQKQRELCAKKIKEDAMKDFGSDIPDCWTEDSILNAKLEI